MIDLLKLYVKSIPSRMLVWFYYRTKALNTFFAMRLWRKKVAYEMAMQAEYANSKALALSLSDRLCRDTGVCASKRMGFGKVLTDEEVLERFANSYSQKEQNISARLIKDLEREKANG